MLQARTITRSSPRLSPGGVRLPLQHRRDVARKQLLYLTLKFVGVRICLSDTGYCLCPIDQETMIFIVVLVVGIFDRGYVLEEFSFLFWGASEACRLARSSQ
jgi:hypothetical protein